MKVISGYSCREFLSMLLQLLLSVTWYVWCLRTW